MDSDGTRQIRERASGTARNIEEPADSADDPSPVSSPVRSRDREVTTALLSSDVSRHPIRVLLPSIVERATATLRTGHTPEEQKRRLTTLFLRALQVAEIPGEPADHHGTEPAFTVEEATALQRTLVWAVARSGTTPVDGGDLARVLSSLDAVPNRTEALSDASRTFGERLGSVDAIQAVVEIAHDMQSPLASILFLVDTLRRGQSGPVTMVQERQLGLIYGATLGLNNLSCDVLDALRGGQRLIEGLPVPFSIANVVLDVCDTVRPISEEKGLSLSYVLPAVDGRIGYGSALERVLLNLVTNALKYTPEGSVRIGCTERSEREIEFSVEDTGKGIPPDVMSMLFDGFRPTASGIRFSNAGLGLAICQNYLRDLGSALQVQSSPVTGTRFSFVLDLPPV